MIGKFFGWLVIGTLLVPASAQAQEALAGHLVMDSFAPKSQTAAPIVDLRNFSGTTVPFGADRVPLDIGGVRFEGDACPMPEAAAWLQKALTVKGLTVADLYARVHTMEQFLANAGYVLTRVTVPPQQIVSGNTVIIRIINGRIDNIDVSSLPDAIRQPIKKRLAFLLNRPMLRRADIERALLVAGDLGGLSLRSTFAPGNEPGSTKLILDGTFRRINGSIGVDSLASDALGSWETNASVSVNSLFNIGEQLYFSYQGDPLMTFSSNARMRILASGAVVPIGSDGLTVSPEVVWSRILPQPQNGVPNSQNELARASLRVNYPLVRQADYTIMASSSVEALNQRVKATDFGITLTSDSYVAVQGGLDAQSLVSPSTTVFGSIKISQGMATINSVFSGVAGAPSTHFGAGPQFSKISGTAGVTNQIGPLTASLFMRGQTSFGHPLFNSEQLNLDGINALSGLSPGAYAVDEGATVRAELGHSLPFNAVIDGVATPYLFSALGAGQIYNATAVESTTSRAADLGAGVRLKLWNKGDQTHGLGLNFEVGHSWIGTVTAVEATRANLALNISF